jgi:hypothetical protein
MQTGIRYDYFERDVKNQGSKTYHVMMILGSPYRLLEAVAGAPLSSGDRGKEQQKLEEAIARRCGESKRQTETRIQEYKKDVERDHRLVEEMTRAFVFRLLGETTVEGRMTWLLQATPRLGYRPPDNETKVLTGMQGQLWIDEATFQWARVEARVIHAVSIEGFLARVEPGTRFGLTEAPVPGGVWLPKQFSTGSKARVLSFIAHNTRDEETYFNYQKASLVKIPACPANSSSGRVER